MFSRSHFIFAIGYLFLGLYVENLQKKEEDFNNYSDGTFSHNMEWITYEAIKFINQTIDDDKNFFMYFNPTVPHASNNVKDAINEFSCQDIADKDYEWPGGNDPWIKGMSEDDGCEAYRDTITERANDNIYNLGPIWLDDAIGALVNALIDNGIYDDTIIVFQEDHGMDNKKALYEGGVRIPQFVHYPAGIKPGTFNAPVSTVDLAPTLMEYAGIEQPYKTDGTSWKQAVEDSSEDMDRCLFFENDQDRAVRCGCYKYVDINNGEAELSGTWEAGLQDGLAKDLNGMLFDLCDGGEAYVTEFDNIREKEAVDNGTKQLELAAVLQCHLDNTDPGVDPVFTDCSELLGDDDDGGLTDSPTNLQTNSPTNSPTKNPTNSPTESPTESSTDAPTNVPTKSPTSSPTSLPTESSVRCEDDSTYYFNSPRRTCERIGERNSGRELINICNRNDPNNGNKPVSDFCRLTCNVCSGSRSV